MVPKDNTNGICVREMYLFSFPIHFTVSGHIPIGCSTFTPICLNIPGLSKSTLTHLGISYVVCLPIMVCHSIECTVSCAPLTNPFWVSMFRIYITRAFTHNVVIFGISAHFWSLSGTQ